MKKRTRLIGGIAIAFIILSAVTYFGITGMVTEHVSSDVPATLTYVFANKNIQVALTEEETVLLAEIFNGRDEYRGVTPSCGFDKNISVTVDGVTFAPACDLCNSFMNFRNLSYFDISEDDMAAVRKIFEKYGGTFPCI